MPETIVKKVTKALLVVLLPTLFILGYFSFKGSPGDLSTAKRQVVSAGQLTGFIAGIDSQMVLITGGNFYMGSNVLTEMEKPKHEVGLNDFFISKTMVTVEQFGIFIEATGYKTNAERDSGSFVFNGKAWAICKGVNWQCDELGRKQLIINNTKPVLHISWYDAQQFCSWLKKIAGKNYRLPTEAEWEYAAGGGNKTAGYIYSGSNDANEVAWNGTNSGLMVHPVGQKKPNELGLYDMSGDAWQWCSDWYGKNYYTQSPLKNPQGPDSGLEKVCHGGSYLSGAGTSGDTGPLDQVNPASRGKEFPYLSASDGSFRIALSAN